MADSPFDRLGLLDRVLAAYAPGLALKRHVARQQLSLRMRYDAAQPSRRTAAWRAPASSADAAGYELGARARLRHLARDMVRNRPYAARGVSVITGNVVGGGIAYASTPLDADAGGETVARAERVLAEFFGSTAIDAGEQHTLASMQRLVQSAVVTDGEVLVRRRWRPGVYGTGLPLPFQVEVIEADLLDPWRTSYGENEVIEGVEYGPTGRIEAYHLLREHPGSVLRRAYRRDSVRISASEILHIARRDRPGQTRGVTWFAPVMMTLGELSDYQEAEIVKQKMAALLAGVIENELPEDPAAPTDPEAAAAAAGLGALEPGVLVDLPPGQKVNWTTPPRVDGYDPFTRRTLAAVAMGLGITYESLAGDLSNVNFSSARMGRIEMDRNIEEWQRLIMIGQFCTGVARWVAEAWPLRFQGERLPVRLDWTAPRRPPIDPREVTATIAEVNAGLTSLERAQRSLGRDPETIQEERLRDIVRARALAAAEQQTQTGGPNA